MEEGGLHRTHYLGKLGQPIVTFKGKKQHFISENKVATNRTPGTGGVKSLEFFQTTTTGSFA